MDIKRILLSHYKNATENFYITQIKAPTQALELHSHNYFQIYYILSGRVIHHLESTSATLVNGDVFILPPNIPHYIEASQDVNFYAMSFKEGYFNRTDHSNKLIYDFLYYLKSATLENIHPKISLSYDDSTFALSVVERIMYEFSSHNNSKAELIKGCVSVLLSLLAGIYFEEKADVLNTTLNKNAISHCVEYINNHFDDDITLVEMAKLSTMSKTRFCAMFYEFTGDTFNNYLNNVRIKKAKEYISKGEKISVVSSLCGYSNFSTFYRNFKKYMNLSPVEYQKSVRNE